MGRGKGKKGAKMPAVVWIVGALVLVAILAFPSVLCGIARTALLSYDRAP